MEIKLYEDTLPKSLNVIFSSKINNAIISIKNYNQNNTEALAKWYDYLDGIKKYVSNRSVAWDYANRIRTFRNGTKFIGDFNYNVGYTVKWNSYEAYVYIFMINLNPQEFGLKIPPTLKENKAIYTNKTMNTQNKQTIRLTESQLRNMIKESVNVLLNEMDLDRNYTDDSGNKISGKEGLQKGGGLAMLNQMKHLYKVLFNFLKTIKNRGGIYLTKQSDVRLNRPIDGEYEEDITNYGLKFLQALEGEIKSFEYYTPNYWIEKTKGYDPFDPKHDHFHGNPI